MTAWCAQARAGLGRWCWLCLGLMLVSLVSPAAAVEPILVQLDQATIMHLPDRAATVVVGNPLIADLTVQEHGAAKVAIITGKGYGATNFIVLDRAGVVLSEQIVEVGFPGDKVVIVYRGMERETYSCDSVCSRRITLGDDPAYFDKTLAETASRDTQAAAAGAKAAR